jgi:hypothetical protein
MILVSAAAPMLVAGSGVDARGEQQLKGIPETWQLFAIRP